MYQPLIPLSLPQITTLIHLSEPFIPENLRVAVPFLTTNFGHMLLQPTAFSIGTHHGAFGTGLLSHLNFLPHLLNLHSQLFGELWPQTQDPHMARALFVLLSSVTNGISAKMLVCLQTTRFYVHS